MSKPVNKTVIGIFVVGAVALAVAAVMVVGSGKFLTKKQQYVMYFEDSVKGLSIGSPLMWRGVKIGSVTDISLIFDASKLTFIIPVYVEVDSSKITSTGLAKLTQYAYLNALIEKGMRAQLETQSFVTGQLMINFAFFPDKPARFMGLDKSVLEVPTIPSTVEQLAKDIQNLPWKELFDNMHEAVEGINKIINSPATASTIKNMDQALGQANQVLNTINEEMRPTIEEIRPILNNFKETTLLVRNSATKVNDEALSGEKGVPAQLEKTFESLQKVLAQSDATLQKDGGYCHGELLDRTQAGETMDELSRAGAAMRVLADFLQRHPEALIQGKKAP